MSRQFTRPRPTIAVPSVAAPEIADYDSRNASFTLALTIPGDTLLYLLLPLHLPRSLLYGGAAFLLAISAAAVGTRRP